MYPGNTTKSLVCVGAGSTTNYITQSLNAGNTNNHVFSAWAMKEDLSAITSADCNIWYDDAKASTYTSEGNGVYRVSWSGAGINAAKLAGLQVKSGIRL